MSVMGCKRVGGKNGSPVMIEEEVQCSNWRSHAAAHALQAGSLDTRPMCRTIDGFQHRDIP